MPEMLILRWGLWMTHISEPERPFIGTTVYQLIAGVIGMLLEVVFADLDLSRPLS